MKSTHFYAEKSAPENKIPCHLRFQAWVTYTSGYRMILDQ